MLCCVVVILLGLGSRSGFARSHLVPKDVGDLLYAIFVFFLLVLALPRASTFKIAGCSFLFCLGIELFKLIPSPMIEPLRESVPGRLILGRDFSVLDIADYVIGVLLAIGFDLWLTERRLRSPSGA